MIDRPTITLCMIVKDEEHVIKRCLESIYKYIDRYDISDTGSTDKTKEIIKEFFDEFKRLGVLQIRLDYYVERKKESQIPKRHGYFKAKHTFLFHVAEVELEIYEFLESALS